MHRLVAACSFLALLTVPAFAADCPVESMAPAEVEKLIVAAPGCERSLKIFQSCGMGASSDVRLGGVVTEKCEAVFEGRLSAAQKRAYSRAQAICGKKYEKETGTMYRSFEAFCSAEAAARVARQFSKTSPARPAKP
jgi:hypothetical protein